MELIEILKKIAVPRPDHSEAMTRVAAYIKELLASWHVPFVTQEFPLRYHAHLLIGVTALILALLFFIFIFKKRPVFALITVLVIPLIIILEIELSTFVVSPLLQRPAENIIVSFNTPDAARELVFAAHYDSKTDVWDHVQRGIILKLFTYAVALGILLSIWTFFVRRFALLRKMLPRAVTIVLAAAFVVYAGFAYSWLGGYIFISDDRQSLGAVDDGGAVVTLLALARDIKDGKVNTGDSNITIVLTGGEEVGLQGAYWYVKERFGDKPVKPKVPVSLVNLELAGQNGNMIYWKKVGVLFRFYDADPGLIKRMNNVWTAISGKPMDAAEKISDDSMNFVTAGIPVITVGNSGLPGRGLAGFHSIHDNMERVNPKNLKLMIKTLKMYIESY